MTVEEFIYDIMEIKGALEDDSDLDPIWVLYKINQYRASHISADFALNQDVDPVWIQRITKFEFEKVNPADDPAITLSSITLGKYKLPRVIKLTDDLGTYRLSGSGAINIFEPCDFNRLLMKAEFSDDLNPGYGYYSKIGDTAYIYPYILEGSAMIIAEDPFDIQINDNGVLRDMLLTDDYPLDPILAQRVILDILKNDLNISDSSISDIMNDSQSQFKILKSATRSQ